MAIILDLPFQERIDQSSGPTLEGYDTTTIQYGGKVSQTTFNGPDAESSKEEVWKVNWAFLEYATPAEVAGGAIDEVAFLRNFFRQVQTGFVKWRPFELGNSRIWKVVPKSLKIKQTAGCIFTASLNLELQYEE